MGSRLASSGLATSPMTQTPRTLTGTAVSQFTVLTSLFQNRVGCEIFATTKKTDIEKAKKKKIATLTDTIYDEFVPLKLQTRRKFCAMLGTVKPSEEEKSSDEESIHLILEADDDKTPSPDTAGEKKLNKSPQINGESEEEILNKYDSSNTNGTPDVTDNSLEDTLLESADAPPPETEADEDTLLRDNDEEKTEAAEEIQKTEEREVDDEKIDEEKEALDEKKSDEQLDDEKVAVQLDDGQTKEDQAPLDDEMSSEKDDEQLVTDETLVEEKPPVDDETTKIDETKTEEALLEEKVTEEDEKALPDEKEEQALLDGDEQDKPDPEENSNDSNKSSGEDLMDISIIRDADEDNASAIAEEACDNEERKRTEARIESDDKEQMDFEVEDGGDDKEQTSSGDSDRVNDHEEEEMAVESVVDNKTIEEKVSDSETDKVKTDELNVTEELTDVDETETKTKKRSLSTDEFPQTDAKKMRLSDDEEETKPKPQVDTLLSFSNFMQDKQLKRKLSRCDLEQFCLQKICEVIMHKTVEGDMHQQIKRHEQTIEALRKDVQQLSKQARDLEIVNRKLMGELKQVNGNKKPLVPLKITRSVGLQVKMAGASVDVGNRRRVGMVGGNVSPMKVVGQRTIQRTTPNIIRQNSTPPKQSPKQIQLATPAAAPLLSQALQTRRPVNTIAKRITPIRPKQPPDAKTNASVIDLTDEDDKSAKSKPPYKAVPLGQAKTIPVSGLNKTPNQTKMFTQLKTTPSRTVTTLPQGVRLTTAPVKNGVALAPGTPLMYVVQPNMTQGIVTTTTPGGQPKAVIVNLQPTTNGVLTSALNGSAVSVIPKAGNQQVKLVNPRKHPAPLPAPPVMKQDPKNKPIPPKPMLSIRKTDTGIILQWKMPYNLDMFEQIASYQLYAYQETNAPPSTEMWRRVGDVKALALPMACTLTQFADKNKYYFAVRSVDVLKRIGQFSDPEEISL